MCITESFMHSVVTNNVTLYISIYVSYNNNFGIDSKYPVFYLKSIRIVRVSISKFVKLMQRKQTNEYVTIGLHVSSLETARMCAEWVW